MVQQGKKLRPNGGQKYKIVNFEASNAFEVHKLYFARHIFVLGPLNGEKRAKTMAKWEQNTKSPILRPIFHLEHCKSINGLKKWLCKQNNTKMYFIGNR